MFPKSEPLDSEYTIEVLSRASCVYKKAWEVSLESAL